MRTLLFIGLLIFGSAASAAEVDDLSEMLDYFLAGASIGDVDIHDSFWDDNLVYTSSAGTRTNKESILDGMRHAAAEDHDASDEGPSVLYKAEEVDIDLYGDTAIVAFKLVGTPQGESSDPVAYYLNTGTFLKRDGAWKVVAWQATRIPDSTD